MRWALVLTALALAGRAGADQAEAADVVLPTPLTGGSALPQLVSGDGALPLRLCDCYASATAKLRGEEPNDLSCDKEGFFIAGFQRAGVFSGTQSTAFPLSAALCCRPCFADDPVSAAISAEVAAVVSTACVQSRWEADGQACPANTLVMGYDNARLGSPINRYYPVGPAQCCRPALLLKNGSTRLLRRCAGCGAPNGGSEVSCGGGDDEAASQQGGRLLAGWASVLRQPGSSLGLGDAIPLAPAQCCGVCLDASEPAQGLPCEAANFCSGHGECGVSGRCVCDAGYGGTACADGASSGTAALVDAAPFLGMAVLVAAACFFAVIARANALSRALVLTRRAAAHAAATRRAELEQPLLPVSSSDDDAEWGAGSSDEEESELDDDEEDREAADGDAAQQPEQAQPPAEGDADGAYSPPDEVAHDDDDKTTAVAGEAAQAAAVPRRNWLRNAPECNVCMDARVQICFLPCGHACACRPCARRLRRCPICRVIITRRQKLFLSATLD